MTWIAHATRRHLGGLYLALAVLALYMLSSGGDLFISDGEVMLKTTAELAFHGRVALAPDAGLPQIVPGRDGRFFSKYGLGQPLASVPFFRAGLLLARLGDGPEAGDGIMRLVVVSLNAWAGAAAAFALYLCARALAGEPAALMVAALSALATPAWPYAKIFFSEPLLGLCLLVALYAAMRSARPQAPQGRAGLAWPLLCGLAAGYAMLTKPLAGVALPVLGLYLGFARSQISDPRSQIPDPKARQSSIINRQSSMMRVLAFAAGAAPLVALTLFHNYYRFGSIADNGYGAERFSTPLYVGLYGLLISSGRGAIWYAPPLLLGLFGTRALWRRERALALLVAGLVLPPLLISARWWAWHGGWGWGPRLIVPYIPLVLLCAAPLLAAGRSWRLAWALLIAGALVQLPGVAVNFNAYMAAVGQSPVGRQLAAPAAPQHPVSPEADTPYLLPDDLAYYVPEYSPIVGQGRMLLRGQNLFVGGLAMRGRQPALGTVLSVLWIVILMSAAALLLRRLAAFRQPSRPARQRSEPEAFP